MPRLRWWRETLIAVGGYGLYALIRNFQGRATDPAAYQRALGNALHILHAEQLVDLDVEKGTQHLFLHSPTVLKFLDTFWATAYLLVTIAVVIWLIRWQPGRYRRCRSALAVGTGIGLAIFAMFPAIPPRLLPARYGLVDTWTKVGGIAARTPPRLERISDPFAAMPSIHIAWAVWCAAAVFPLCKSRWTRAVVIAYPLVTLVAVVASGNHFVLDAVAGALCIAVGFWVASSWERRHQQPSWHDQVAAPGVEEPDLILVGASEGS